MLPGECYLTRMIIVHWSFKFNVNVKWLSYFDSSLSPVRRPSVTRQGCTYRRLCNILLFPCNGDCDLPPIVSLKDWFTQIFSSIYFFCNKNTSIRAIFPRLTKFSVNTSFQFQIDMYHEVQVIKDQNSYFKLIPTRKKMAAFRKKVKVVHP